MGEGIERGPEEDTHQEVTIKTLKDINHSNCLFLRGIWRMIALAANERRSAAVVLLLGGWQEFVVVEHLAELAQGPVAGGADAAGGDSCGAGQLGIGRGVVGEQCPEQSSPPGR